MSANEAISAFSAGPRGYIGSNQMSPLTDQQRKDIQLELLVEQLERAAKGMASLIDAMNARAPYYIYEYNSGASPLSTVRSTNNLIRVSAVVVQFPSAATAISVQLGPITLPIDAPPSAGYVVIAPIQQVLQPMDPRTLTFSGGGTGTLWIMGDQIPSTGSVR